MNRSATNKSSPLGAWLELRCRAEGLSLRQASLKVGLSHATISDVMKGACPSPETIRKLAEGFSKSGNNHRLALEDELLVLAGYRSERPEGEELSEPMARLLDKLSTFSQPQLKIMGRFADFISTVEKV